MLIPVPPLCLHLGRLCPQATLGLLLTLADPGMRKKNEKVHSSILRLCQISPNVCSSGAETVTFREACWSQKYCFIFNLRLGETKHNLEPARRYSDEEMYQWWGWTIWHHKSGKCPCPVSGGRHRALRSQRDAHNQSNGHRALDIEIAFAAFNRNKLFFRLCFSCQHKSTCAWWKQEKLADTHTHTETTFF